MRTRAVFFCLLIIASALFGVKVGSTGENIYLHGGKTGVNVDTTDTPDAVFEVRSDDDGILIPRLTIAQRNGITGPALGLLIYNTDCGLFNYFDGESWIPFPNLTGLDVGPIDGVASVCESATFVEYTIDPVEGATTYEWTVPDEATILSGAGTTTISVDYGSESGRICVTAVTPCGSVRDCLDITVNPAPVGGTVTGGGTISLGEPTGTLTLSGHTGSVDRWMKRLDGGIWTDIAYTGTTYSETPTSSGGWDYCAVITTTGCPAAFSDYTTVTVEGSVSDTIVFTYTGAEQTWTVPGGVTSIDIECRGAQGGGSNGGQGGVSTGTLAVTPGETLYIYVGEQPATVTSGIGPGGFNGGGFGFWQPGGGGASDVRQGGNSYSDRVIVAGGGGGQYDSYRGGNGGGTTGENATWTNNGNLPYGGTQTDGGRWGSGFGTGGTGGTAYNAGGGGGGWYGGGSGEDIMTNVTGAGGSGYIGGVTSGVTTQGGNTGNGEVTISW